MSTYAGKYACKLPVTLGEERVNILFLGKRRGILEENNLCVPP